MNIFDLIGNTPLLDLGFLTPDKSQINLYAKAEWLNPGGSLKDRPVKYMLSDAIDSKQLTADKIILDSSSGNAGISYGMLGAALGYQVSIVLPGNASEERKQRLRAHGVNLIETDPLEGYDEALRHVHELFKAYPERYFFCDQYSNQQNVRAHYDGTGVELIQQSPTSITHFVCGVGTGGSLTGIARRLHEHDPSIRVIGVQPERWPGIEGLKPLGEAGDIVPAILDTSVVDEWRQVSADEAKGCCLKMAKKGYFVGQSSGAYLAVCMQLMDEISEGTITTLLGDLGERYISTGLWNDVYSH